MKKIIWVVRRNSLGLASLRYRTLLPALGLKDKVKNVIVHKDFPNDLSDVSAVIFCKAFSENNVKFAFSAKKQNIKILIELCDNIFIDNYSNTSFKLDPNFGFYEILPLACGIITTTNQLKETIKLNLPLSYRSIPFHLSPDGIENIHLLDQMSQLKDKITYRFFYSKLKAYFNNSKSKIKHLIKILIGRETEDSRNLELIEKIKMIKRNKVKIIVWYGNSGNKNFGLSDLHQVLPILEKSEVQDFRFILVSDNELESKNILKQYRIKSIYYKWNLNIIYQLLKITDLVIVPNQMNEFSICKSPNRTLLALAHNVPVIADITPALEKYKTFIHHGSWKKNIQDFLEHKLPKNIDLFIKSEEGSDLLPEKIGENYLSFLESVHPPSPLPEQVTIFIQFIQDFILFEPLIDKLISTKRLPKIYILKTALLKSEKVQTYYNKYKDYSIIFKKELLERSDYPFFMNSRYLLTASESNLSPHKWARKLVNIANGLGVETYTFQHGYENIGLTYSDYNQDIKSINFKSKKIFIWGDITSLHPEIPMETKKKCISLGVLKKPVAPTKNSIKKQISVFENLHWSRFSTNYKTEFLKSIEMAAKEFPSIDFMIQTHPAGKWLEKNEDLIPKRSNIKISNVNISAQDLIIESLGTLTTPSTIAIDSLINNKPTAVFNFDQKIKSFENSFLVNSPKDLIHFVTNILDSRINNYSGLKNSKITQTNASQIFIDNYISYK